MLSYCTSLIVNCSTAMLKLIPIFLLYSICQQCPCCLMFEIGHCHYCSVDAPAYISALFLIRKWICVVLGRKRLRSSRAAVCTHVLYTGLYSCLVSSLGANPFTVLFSHVVVQILWLFWNVLDPSDWNLDTEGKKEKQKEFSTCRFRAYYESAGQKLT